MIRKVDEPMDWVNSMVIVENPNKKLRICLDPRNLNTAIKREHNTPFGRYCYLRTPFGIKSAQEVYRKRISQLFEDIEGVETDTDDILL